MKEKERGVKIPRSFVQMHERLVDKDGNWKGTMEEWWEFRHRQFAEEMKFDIQEIKYRMGRILELLEGR